jgi:excisionase family DNA binding protein
MAEMISISEAAKRIGISRPRLSKLIDEAKLEKTRNGKNMLVDLSVVQKMMQGLAAEQKLRTPRPTRKKDDQSEFVDHLKAELRRISLEREQLAEKLVSLQAVQTEVKLLAAKEEAYQKERESLVDKAEGYDELKAENRLLKSEIEKRDTEGRGKSGILSRLDKALQSFRGE